MKYTREQALDRIRDLLASLQREGETTCQTVARLGIFCRGYDRWAMPDLSAQYPWIAKKMPAGSTRTDLLKRIVEWDTARTLFHRVKTTCDAKALDVEGCLGFDRFSNEELKNLFPQLFTADDEITQD